MEGFHHAKPFVSKKGKSESVAALRNHSNIAEHGLSTNRVRAPLLQWTSSSRERLSRRTLHRAAGPARIDPWFVLLFTINRGCVHARPLNVMVYSLLSLTWEGRLLLINVHEHPVRVVSPGAVLNCRSFASFAMVVFCRVHPSRQD